MNKRRQISVTSDLHLGHPNCLVFDQRPFRNLEHMHEVIVNNFNSSVSKDGITYLLGDIGWSVSILSEIIPRLNGVKILISGNHDRSAQSMYECGFQAVLQSASIMIAGELVTMSHYPLLGVRREPTDAFPGQENNNWHGEHKHGHLAIKDMGQFHLHGHIHSGPHTPRKKRILGRQLDVGVVANNYRPVSVSTIESWIAKTKQPESQK